MGFGKTTKQSSTTNQTTNTDNSVNNTDNRSVVSDNGIQAGAGATVNISQSSDSVRLAQSVSEASLNVAAAASREVAELAGRSVDTIATTKTGEGTPTNVKTYAMVAGVGLLALVAVIFIMKGK